MAIFQYGGGGGSGSSPAAEYVSGVHPADTSKWTHKKADFTDMSSLGNTDPFFVTGAGGFWADNQAVTGTEHFGLGILLGSSYATITTGSQTFDWSTNEVRMYAIVDLQQLPDATDDYILGFGFFQNAATLFTLDHSALVIDRSQSATNWIYTAGTTSANYVDTGVAIDVSGPITIEVRKNEDGSSTTAYVNGALVHTETTNIPVGNIGVQMTHQPQAGTPVGIRVDTMGYSYRNTQDGLSWGTWD